ncbi:Rne/Rng family ribonuclease [Tessaracoccus aquimaris]|uniref:Rne/Rng family ribonuclease n=1 Tax=Tessaracoccus aquimaris TaxID=1332264 RepID=UPI003AAD1001
MAVVEAPAPVETPAEEPEAVEVAKDEVVEETPEPTQPRARGRRRASRPAAAPTEAPADGDDDPIGAALRAAEDLAEARKSVLADPFMTKEARDAQLAALAGAIAADDAADDDEDDDEETAHSEEDGESHEDDDASDDESDDSGDDDSSDEDGDRPARRRRRRGGRRRRRGGPRDEDDNDDQGDSTGEDDSNDEGEESASEDDSDDQDHTESDGDSSSTTRRRRRRRRRGDTDKEGSSDNDEVTGIEGSTRMEAKRQRRKESRAAGRRRAPILSEAEFLARRESVDRTMVIRQSEDYTQLAVIEDDILVEHYVDKASATSLIGNIYVGKVQNVLPSMEAAFVDIGRGRNAVLYAGEVDWASFGVTGENRKVENVLKSGQSVLVQVTKDPVGAKGARLTSHISLPGRYIVYSPGGHLSGISRKLPDSERQRLRNVLGHLISDEESVIVRTAAEGVSEDELVRDVNRLKAQWEVIEKKSKQGGAPQALYAEPDLTLRIVRDLFTEDFGHLIVQGNGDQDDAFDAISAYVGHVAPHLLDRVERFDGGDEGKDVFSKFRVDEQIAKALDRKVYLPSGGSLVIDRTEAMTVIDVNTGRFTGSAGNLEATVTSNNLEAAEEIVRQLRLRDLGGIIVIDFIDMVLPSNRDLLLRRLVECLGRDRTRHQVAEVTSLGLVQLTRKRIGTGLQEAFTEQCEHCHGAGYQRFGEPVDSQAPADGGDRRSNGRRRRK